MMELGLAGRGETPRSSSRRRAVESEALRQHDDICPVGALTSSLSATARAPGSFRGASPSRRTTPSARTSRAGQADRVMPRLRSRRSDHECWLSTGTLSPMRDWFPDRLQRRCEEGGWLGRVDWHGPLRLRRRRAENQDHRVLASASFHAGRVFLREGWHADFPCAIPTSIRAQARPGSAADPWTSTSSIACSSSATFLRKESPLIAPEAGRPASAARQVTWRPW